MNAVTDTKPAAPADDQRSQKDTNPIATIRHQLGGMEEQFKRALPAHIPVERFTRVVMTAIQNNGDLLAADRRSLFNSAMRAAQDGLLPDGREGAMVLFKNTVQWMPMIAGLRKKVRNSGEIATWDAQVVHANDHFEFELGDDPFIKHRPALQNPGKVIAAYSVAVLKSGEKSREVMSIDAIEQVRGRSRAKNNGPWVTDYEEMCRKTVARRHSKVLPMSTDMDDLIRRDDELYDMKGAGDAAIAAGGAGKTLTLAGKLDALGGGSSSRDEIPHDPDTGEVDQDDARDNSGDQPETRSAVEGTSVAADKGAGGGGGLTPSSASDAKQTTSTAKPDASGDDRKRLIFEDLKKTGDAAAARGRAALDDFLDGLNGDEMDLVQSLGKGWRAAAKAAGDGGGR